ncbi:hypothetical protein CQ040_16835 [Microbacterium sp. MYb54]|nr:hypothetical protein CQ032_16185 [Microbacterium sp. MYb43]PQZ73241.1 hypothetical protein CQ031_17540 [Microbacterium sp. MYb40]PRB18740.1 hypothetical protein CQ040_16835 [Microbacterium sp. MYb54]PRB24368.1 hypothetical protein CQ037_16960 [Microbacterium sp. MYb50]PRB67232.1 hypothetical protein CQ021_08265 [Microbacterium sp. MYb24]PRB69608.1 hypothetical protein CQ027_16970 [Microbacterium sp. MYb32]
MSPGSFEVIDLELVELYSDGNPSATGVGEQVYPLPVRRRVYFGFVPELVEILSDQILEELLPPGTALR